MVNVISTYAPQVDSSQDVDDAYANCVCVHLSKNNFSLIILIHL